MKPLTFRAYIDESDESISAFSKRSGVALTTCQRWYDESPASLSTAELIVRASHDRPTPSGGVVTFEELVPSESVA